MNKQKTLFRALSATTALAVFALQLLPFTPVSAAQITNRSLTLQSGTVDSNLDGINDGGSLAGGIANHLFTFTADGAASLGSIKFQYCTTAAPVVGGIQCDIPAGIDTTGAALGNESGTVTGFSVAGTPTNGTIVLTRPAAAAGAGASSYRLDGIENPSANNTTFFVRITTHASLDGTGAADDAGTVNASTADPIELSGTMPESLVFCTGRTIGLTGGVPDCATATDGVVSFDKLFSPTDTALASSQMAASTNATAGYVITVNGPTLSSGSNTISALASTAAGIKGVSQFGINLRLNTAATGLHAVTSDPIGADITVASNGTNYRAQPSNNYKVVDQFRFVTGDSVANSWSNGNDADAVDTAGGSDSQIYTASYIVNVPGSQPAGTYTTTLTYICTPTF